MGSGTNVTVPVPLHGRSSEVGIALTTPYQWKVTVEVVEGTGVGGGGPKNAAMLLAFDPVYPSLVEMTTGRRTSTDWPAIG
jgi:hypothetical protein